MSIHLRRAGIALGSNIEPRVSHLQAAVAGLRQLHSGREADFLISCVYETEPEGCPPGTAPFLNAAAELTTVLSPEALLAELQKLEARGGRPSQHPPNSPRTIDLDLLYLGEEVRHSKELELPHPRLTARAFVLVPLSEIAPDRVLPGQTSCLAQLANECGLAGVRLRWDCQIA